MSNTDSFIDEVTEEVRRDRLYTLIKRYGWIAILAVILLVGGAAWNEWNKARERARAQAFGDEMMAALEGLERTDRTAGLSGIKPPTPAGAAVLNLLAAGEESADAPDQAAQRLLTLADRSDVDLVYRQIATLKAVMIPNSGLGIEDRRLRLDGLATGSGIVRLMAEEQLALIDVELGNTAEAIERLTGVVEDSAATPGLRRRASQVIVALGGEVQGAQQSGE